MKTKIRDLIQTLKIDHRHRRKTELKLLEELGGRSWKLRKRIKHIKNSLRDEQSRIESKYETKINHYRSTMCRLVANRAVSMDEMNKAPEGGMGKRPVGIDGMNKAPKGGGRGNGEGSLDVDGMSISPKKDLSGDTRATVIPTIPPKDLQEFSTTSIFNSPEDLPNPIKPSGPFVTSKDIKLTKSEIKLLSKDPKYSLVFPPTKMRLSIENY